MRIIICSLLTLGFVFSHLESSFAGSRNIYGVSAAKNFYGVRKGRTLGVNNRNSTTLYGVGRFTSRSLGGRRSLSSASYGGLRNNYFGSIFSSSSWGDSEYVQPQNENEDTGVYGEARNLYKR